VKAKDPRDEAANKRAVECLVRGWDLFVDDHIDEALDQYEEAIRLDPYMATTYLNRGLLLSEYDSDAAISDYDKAIRLDRNLVAAYICRGDAFRDLGDDRRAIADYELAQKLHPDDATLGRLRTLRGDTTRVEATVSSDEAPRRDVRPLDHNHDGLHPGDPQAHAFGKAETNSKRPSGLEAGHGPTTEIKERVRILAVLFGAIITPVVLFSVFGKDWVIAHDFLSGLLLVGSYVAIYFLILGALFG
jgi:tetratricopeptide (TPR) repeat protein